MYKIPKKQVPQNNNVVFFGLQGRRRLALALGTGAGRGALTYFSKLKHVTKVFPTRWRPGEPPPQENHFPSGIL